MSLETLLAFAFVLGVVVVVHEAGHFLVAKSVGIYCKTFSIGFGPKVLRRRIGETEYALSAIPFGGYVKMAGEGAMEQVQDTGAGSDGLLDLDPDGNPIPAHRWFSSKTTWQRLAVVVAGPLMNLVLALVVTTAVVAVQGITVNPVTTVGEVVEGSPADEAGLASGDRILRVAGEDVDSWGSVLNEIIRTYRHDESAVDLTVLRDGVEQAVTLLPRENQDGALEVGMRYLPDTRVGLVKKDGPAWNAGLRRGDIITAIDGSPVVSYSEIAEIINKSIEIPLEIEWQRDGVPMNATVIPESAEIAISLDEVQTIGRIYYEQYVESRPVSLGRAVTLGAMSTWGMVEQTADFLGKYFTGRVSGDAVSGPIRIAQFSGEMVRWGFDRLLLFLSLFSVNLFLLNLLPVPVLDGGHVVFIVYEMIAGRRPNERLQMWATQAGFIILLLFMAYVLTRDVLHVVG